MLEIFPCLQAEISDGDVGDGAAVFLLRTFTWFHPMSCDPVTPDLSHLFSQLLPFLDVSIINIKKPIVFWLALKSCDPVTPNRR